MPRMSHRDIDFHCREDDPFDTAPLVDTPIEIDEDFFDPVEEQRLEELYQQSLDEDMDESFVDLYISDHDDFYWD